jgi:transketolase
MNQNKELKENLYVSHNRALIKLARENDKIVSCYSDYGSGEVGEVFRQEFPDRYIDVGIAEGHLISSAAGLADAGFIPFTHCHALFAVGRGYNQIHQNVAYDNRNVKIVLCNAGATWAGMGPSHLAVEDIAALRAVPNLVILSPADSVSTEKATYAAAAYRGPVVIRLPDLAKSYRTVYQDTLDFVIGKSVTLCDGNDVAILATGPLVPDALDAAETLGKEGVVARVLDIHTIKPLDEEAVLAAANETGAIVTVEDASVIGGLGGAVAELVSQERPAVIRRVGVKDQFGESGTLEELKNHFDLTPSAICRAAREAMTARNQNR